MNDPRTQLKDLIHVEKGIIPANLCDHIIQDIETRPWKPHTWYMHKIILMVQKKQWNLMFKVSHQNFNNY
jgi:hypothetical protein